MTNHEALQAQAAAVAEHEARLKEHCDAHQAQWGDGAPYFSESTHPFWQSLRQGEFKLNRCRVCRHLHFPPRILCPDCWAEDSGELVATPGDGTLKTFTDLHVVAPALKELAPVRMAVVDLDEGVRILTWLRGARAAQARVGDRCRIVVEQVLGRPWFVANLAP